MSRRKSLEQRIDDLLEKLDEIDPSDADAGDKLTELHDKLNKFRERAAAVESKCVDLEKDASEHEEHAENLAEEAATLEARYRFAIRMLELGYGISERDLDLVSSHAPEDAFRKLTHAARRAIAQGDVDAHGGCAYAGTCIPYQTGLTDTSCGVGNPAAPAHKGRFGTGGRTVTKNSILHASCTPGHCVPAYVGWIPAAESCS